MRARTSVVAAMLVVLVAGVPASQAQEPSREVARQALDQYQRGTAAYRARRYDEAIAAFNRAFELDPAPILIFNIGQAQFKKGERAQALASYRRYLELEPTSTNRAQVEARIRELEAPPVIEPAPEPATPEALPSLTTAQPIPAPPPHIQAPAIAATPPPPTPLLGKRMFWLVLGAVAASAAVTVALLSTRRGPGTFDCGADCNWSTVQLPGR
jgi:tetratricopeptide (TPR) repeat protein